MNKHARNMLAVVPVGQLMSSHLVPFNNNNDALIIAFYICSAGEAVPYYGGFFTFLSNTFASL